MNSFAGLTSTATSAQLSADERLAWMVAFGLLVVVATIGNSLVTWFIVARRRMAKSCSCFMLSLTMADFAMLYFECFFNLKYILEGHWGYGTMYCIIDNFLSELTTAASVFTLTATSYDRYLAIVKPFLPRSTTKSAILTVTSCWFVAFLLALPTLIYSDEFLRRVTNEENILCDLLWPERDIILNSYTYRSLIFITTYALPTMFMTYWNMRIGLVLSRSALQFSQEGGQHRQLNDMIKKRKHLAEGMWTILIIFCVCWLPYQTFLMYQTFVRDLNANCKRFCMAVYWLAVSNAAVNPFLFYRLDKQYQDATKKFFQRVSDRLVKRRDTNSSTISG